MKFRMWVVGVLPSFYLSATEKVFSLLPPLTAILGFHCFLIVCLHCIGVA